MANLIEIQDRGLIKVQWQTKSIGYSPELLDNIRYKIAKKYNVPPVNVTVEPIFVTPVDTEDDGSIKFENVKDMHNPLFQQTMFWDWLKQNDIEDYDKDIILDIDGQVNAHIDYEAYGRCKKYEITYLKWDNFLSYGSGNMFDFTHLNGLVLLNGEPANQSGKSTFAYDLIHYALFGKTSSDKAKVMADYFNYNLPEETTMFVEIGLKIEGVTYIIRRKLVRPELGKKNRNKITQTVEWFRLENGEEIPLDDESNIENQKEGNSIQTNKTIKGAIGNEKDFDLVICANADNLKTLISLKDTERGRILTKWTGLQPLEDKDAIAREIWNKRINNNLKSSIYNKENLKNEIDVLNEDIQACEELVKKNEAAIQDTDGRLSNIDKEKEEKLLSLKKVDDNLCNTDVATIEQAITNICNEGNKKKELIAKCQTELETMGDIVFDEAEYREKMNQSRTLSISIANIKNEIKTLRQTNDDLKNSEYCPTCHRKYEDRDNSELINQNKLKIDQKIQEGIQTKQTLDTIDAEIKELELKSKQKIERDKMELRLNALNAERNMLLASYKEYKALKENYINNKEAIEFNNQINNAIMLLKENVRILENYKQEVITAKTALIAKIEKSKGLIAEKEGLIATIIEEEKLIKNWKIYLQMIGKNGISKMVLRKALPIINAEVKQLLNGVCDFDVEVIIDETNDVAFNLVRNGKTNHLGSGSGFEQTVSALALRVVLGKMSTLSKPPFILLDEVLGGVAKENYKAVRLLFDRITELYKYVFMITHEEEIKEWANSTVTVKKNTEGISSIVY